MRGLQIDREPHEICGFCGFDSELYNQADTITSQRPIPLVIRSALDGLDEETVATRPDPRTWSMAEYVDHVREVAFGIRFAMETALAQSGTDLGDPPDMSLTSTIKAVDVTESLTRVTDEYEAIRDLLDSLDNAQWERSVVISGESRTVGSLARHVLHDGLHHMADIGRIRAGFGQGAQPESGTVTAIHVSQGGVPKMPTASATIGPAGVVGDSQNDRLHHGRPIQAVCLWSADVIADLQAEGHPIAAGSAGENITVAGVSWTDLRPGSMMTVGEIPILITAYAIPCAKNAQWFSDREYDRILHDTNPGWSRLYAIPLAAGVVAPGAVVSIEP